MSGGLNGVQRYIHRLEAVTAGYKPCIFLAALAKGFDVLPCVPACPFCHGV